MASAFNVYVQLLVKGPRWWEPLGGGEAAGRHVSCFPEGVPWIDSHHWRDPGMCPVTQGLGCQHFAGTSQVPQFCVHLVLGFQTL